MAVFIYLNEWRWLGIVNIQQNEERVTSPSILGMSLHKQNQQRFDISSERYVWLKLHYFQQIMNNFDLILTWLCFLSIQRFNFPLAFPFMHFVFHSKISQNYFKKILLGEINLGKGIFMEVIHNMFALHLSSYFLFVIPFSHYCLFY